MSLKTLINNLNQKSLKARITVSPTAPSVARSIFEILSSSVCHVGLKLPVAGFADSIMSIAATPSRKKYT